MIDLLREAKQLSGGKEDEMTIAREVRRKLEAILYLPIITSRYPRLQPKGVKAAAEYLHKKLTDSTYHLEHSLQLVICPCPWESGQSKGLCRTESNLD